MKRKERVAHLLNIAVHLARLLVAVANPAPRRDGVPRNLLARRWPSISVELLGSFVQRWCGAALEETFDPPTHTGSANPHDATSQLAKFGTGPERFARIEIVRVAVQPEHFIARGLREPIAHERLRKDA